jgi:hypothetical protein
MTIRFRTACAILGAFALAALGWVAGGVIVMALDVGELDLPARAGGVVLALSLGDTALAKIWGPG